MPITRQALEETAKTGGRYGNFMVFLVQNCNLRCRYCSTGFGRLGERPVVMGRDLLHKLLDFIAQNSSQSFRVSFSGGETLLEFDLLRECIDRLLDLKERQGKRILIELATNGTLLTADMAEYLASRKVSLTFSVDGDRRTTDRNRVGLPGRESVYGRLLKGIDFYRDAAAKHNSNIRLKAECTVDAESDLYGAVRHLFELGFADVLARPTSSSFFTGFDGGSSINRYLNSFRETVAYILGRTQLADFLIGNYDRMFLNIHKPLHLLASRSVDQPACNVPVSELCVMADGSLMPCYISATVDGAESYRFGSLEMGIDAEKRDRVVDTVNRSREECRTCWCRPYCARCFLNHNALYSDGRVTGYPQRCDLERKTTAIIAEEAARIYGLAMPVTSDD